MTDHPIIFSAPMVRAILDGRKTMMRQAILLPTKSLSGAPIYEHPKMGGWEATTAGGGGCFTFEKDGSRKPSPEMVAIWHRTCGVTVTTRHQPGDRLWVRETWNVFALSSDGDESWPVSSIPSVDPRTDPAMRQAYCVDYPVAGLPGIDGGKGPWRPSTHMPRWASRITLAVEAVRVERLQDITEADARAEGVFWSDDMEGWTSGMGVDHSVDFHGSDPRHSFRKRWNTIHGPDAWSANPWVSVTTFRRVEP